MKRVRKLTKKSLNELARTIKTILFSVLILWCGLLYSQTTIDYYNHFTPKRQQVLSQMGAFFDETIRSNFPADTDTMSYWMFYECIAHAGAFVPINVDKERLNEINEMLFDDHVYYFFYARYIYWGEWQSEFYEQEFLDSVPTIRGFSIDPLKYGNIPVLNLDGYINAVPDENPAIRNGKEHIVLLGEVSLGIFMQETLGANLREISHQIVKEFCAVILWRYFCNIAGVDILERRPFCEPCFILQRLQN